MSSPLQVSRMRAAARRVKAGGERFLGGMLPGASARRLQIRAFADDWAAANLDARRGTGPLWVVLGDSAAQGLGATQREAGYVGVVHELLRRRDAWRVVNLSRAGAGIADVLSRQIPELIDLTQEQPARLVSCIIGAEDIARRVPGSDVALRQVLAALPPGTVVGTFARGSRGGAAAALDAVTREEAARHRLRVAELPPTFGPGGKGKGAALLGDVEHAAWAKAVIAAIDGRPSEVAPSTDPELPAIVPPPAEAAEAAVTVSSARQAGAAATDGGSTATATVEKEPEQAEKAEPEAKAPAEVEEKTSAEPKSSAETGAEKADLAEKSSEQAKAEDA